MKNRLPLTFCLHGDRITLRAPRVTDAGDVLAVRHRSRAFLGPWIPMMAPEDDHLRSCKAQIRHQRNQWRNDQAYALVVADRRTDRFIGRVTFTEVVRSVFQNAALGYWIDVEYAGRGLMSEALSLALGVAFGSMGLHRAQAAIRPHNVASLALARRCGLRREGLAARFLFIDGEWADHEIYAITAEEWSRPQLAHGRGG
ncbi:MAG: GNAT family N-acetyltransferase [Phycisphaerales bacterium]|nr:GNAT family N-acetyltransferase [Phycisphaerales bacterium]